VTQAAPQLPLTGTIHVDASTASQGRGAHGAFRFFGKLAPDVTGAVLDLAVAESSLEGPVVDVMCGSGTTLIEAAARGRPSVGIDVNPVALLYARVKTRAVDGARLRALAGALATAPAASARDVDRVFASTRNAERWFSAPARREIARLRMGIAAIERGRERDALLAALLGRLRRLSNASARTGRVFFDQSSAEEPATAFAQAVDDLARRLPSEDLDTVIVEGDARDTGLADGSAGLCFCHPPYFGLYRYSSDVLRFELEVGGFSRSATNGREVREGWKSGDPSNLELYVRDMGDVFGEARRICRDGGMLALVASNSTLGDLQLPVIDRLAEELDGRGWSVAQHLLRPAFHGMAKYHRSARRDKVIQQDHVLLCRAV
jgi:SAM-dependent methyltransferase